MRSPLSFRNRALTGLAGLALATLAAPGACTGGGDGSAPPPSDDGGAFVDAKADVSSHDAADAGCTTPTTLPPGAPDGWIRPPCSPADCDIVIAPDQAHMPPPPTWTACGDGCVEFISPVPGTTYQGIHTAFGASDGTNRSIAYLYTASPYAPDEIHIVRLPDDTVTFSSIALSGIKSKCLAGIVGFTTERVLFEYWGPYVGSEPRHRIVYTAAVDQAIPTVQFDTTDTQIPQKYAVSPDLWAVVYGGMARMEWHGPTPSNAMNPAWTSPDGRSLENLTASGSAVFFDTWLSDRISEQEVFSPNEGPRTLIPFDSATGRTACCLVTDAKDMVWMEGRGLQPGGTTFTDIALMTAPFATHATDLHPRRLRSLMLDDLRASSVVGGGHVLTLEVTDPSDVASWRLVLTRIQDGARWTIAAPPAEFAWSTPLYVDAEEYAVMKVRLKGGNYSIVRQSIAALGPPDAGDAGGP